MLGVGLRLLSVFVELRAAMLPELCPECRRHVLSGVSEALSTHRNVLTTRHWRPHGDNLNVWMQTTEHMKSWCKRDLVHSGSEIPPVRKFHVVDSLSRHGDPTMIAHTWSVLTHKRRDGSNSTVSDGDWSQPCSATH